MLDGATLELFERAFGSTRRPTAVEWRSVLDSSMKQLRRCTNDPKHSFLAVAGECPWCRLIAVSRLMLFIPGKGAATPFRPEDIDRLILKLVGMRITFNSYSRPKPVPPIQITLPAGLRSVAKPSLLPYPPRPAPVQKPTLRQFPSPPILLPMPRLRPVPPSPSLAQRPQLTPHPATQPSPRPALKPHPLLPTMPPRPTLQPVPRLPAYPPVPTLGPLDPFLARACIAGALSGLPLLLIARPVGVIIMTVFGAWWAIMMATEEKRRELARKSLQSSHEYECARMDEDYAELCRPINEANKQLLNAWQVEKSALSAKYQRLCKRIDDENYRQIATWESADSARQAKHARKCATVDEANDQLLSAWRAKNDATTAEYQHVRDEVEQANYRILAVWKAENAARQAAYDEAHRDVERENQRLTSAFEALEASRQAEHQRSCREIDLKNCLLIRKWEDANAPWLAEEKRWRDRVIQVEADIQRLEAELHRQRVATESRFRHRKDEANAIAAQHGSAKLDYEMELRQAEVDSEKIQLEEHLDKALIRQANVKGVTTGRILSLESFGIETAKDVPLLNTQKVEGIGPVLSRRLFDWRDSLMASFRPQKTLPQSERDRIAGRYAPVMLPLGQSIQGAINDLDTIAMSHRSREAETIKAITTAVQNFAIAEAHVRAMAVG